MKLNLLLDNADGVRDGYVNIDPLSSNDTSRVAADVFNLNHTYDAGEVEEIVAFDILDYCYGPAANEVVDHWISKLQHGGKLVIGTLDAREVSRAYLNGRITLEDFNNLIHAKKGNAGRMCTLTMPHLVEALEGKGMKILQKRISEYRCIITCERP
jgi:hypothetical protein